MLDPLILAAVVSVLNREPIVVKETRPPGPAWRLGKVSVLNREPIVVKAAGRRRPRARRRSFSAQS